MDLKNSEVIYQNLLLITLILLALILITQYLSAQSDLPFNENNEVMYINICGEKNPEYSELFLQPKKIVK